MLRYLIKNNFKLIIRNKWAVLCLLIAPLLTIALLSNAFQSLMASYEAPDEFSVGYRDSGGLYAENMDIIKNAAKEAGILLCEYPEGDPEELIRTNSLSAFTELNEKGYTVYQSENHITEGSITEYFFDRLTDEGVLAVLDKMSPGITPASSVPVIETEHIPAVDSTDYYGIIYIVYFSCCGIISATGMLSSEKKNRIDKKYRVCSLSPLDIYLARLIPAAGAVFVCAISVTLLSVLIFGIHWGSPLCSALIVAMIVLAFLAIGFMVYNLSDNLAITVICMFCIIWVAGFLGGSFETYMFSGFSDTLKNASPFYHANRALVELSVAGKSNYTVSSLLYSAGIFLTASAGAVLSDIIKRRCNA